MPEAETAAPPAVDKSGRAVQEMFAGVAPRYDLLNHLLSGALDFVWRRASARALGLGKGARVLDLCSGTGDQAVAVGKRGPRVAAADFCLPMLVLSKPKFARLARSGPGRATPLAADAQRLPFAAGGFDGATVSFGLRNVADLGRGLAEMARVTAPGGRVAILEFALPRLRPVRALYLFYFRHVLPWIGRLLSGRGAAYSYLPASVMEFPQRDEFCAAMHEAGFENATWRDLALGTVCLYRGEKR
ncbi:MAG TPA: ubiquinone/menaquinone biosynthesis methyltransferase [Thermoanaerobaculia bacterium]|nr:ubiquinone/menaquinone biosynthesis methyltransferase [Thermoanaerobaculia bacterium]